MNQSIEAVKARDRNDPFTTLYFSDLEMYNLEMYRRATRHAPPWRVALLYISRLYRRATRHAPPWPYDSYEELDEAMRRAAEPMHPPTAAELDRMAERWATTSAPVYTAERTATGAWVYTAGTAATSAM